MAGPMLRCGGNMVSDAIQKLASGHCVRCDSSKLVANAYAVRTLEDLPGWVLGTGSIEKEFRFKSYLAGLQFAYSIGKIAEQENHHPDMLVGWRRVRLTFSTHSIKGLSQNDFIMAARSELEYSRANGE
jgi:4a-hydroxytetrahydrobiopterin dehydratase